MFWRDIKVDPYFHFVYLLKILISNVKSILAIVPACISSLPSNCFRGLMFKLREVK